MIDKEIEYNIGYANGYREGWFRACEGLDKLIATLRNPPPIIVACQQSAEVKKQCEHKNTYIPYSCSYLVCRDCGEEL